MADTSRGLLGRAVRANIRRAGEGRPDVPSSLVRWLERHNPPRCRRVGETELEHERYAGRVDLISELRGMLDAEDTEDLGIISRGLTVGMSEAG